MGLAQLGRPRTVLLVSIPTWRRRETGVVDVRVELTCQESLALSVIAPASPVLVLDLVHVSAVISQEGGISLVQPVQSAILLARRVVVEGQLHASAARSLQEDIYQGLLVLFVIPSVRPAQVVMKISVLAVKYPQGDIY